LAIIIVVIIAVVATILTAGFASAFLGTAGTFLGLSGTAATLAAFAVAGAVVGAAASIVSTVCSLRSGIRIVSVGRMWRQAPSQVRAFSGAAQRVGKAAQIASQLGKVTSTYTQLAAAALGCRRGI
jgi:hypothetical protein